MKYGLLFLWQNGKWSHLHTTTTSIGQSYHMCSFQNPWKSISSLIAQLIEWRTAKPMRKQKKVDFVYRFRPKIDPLIFRLLTRKFTSYISDFHSELWTWVSFNYLVSPFGCPSAILKLTKFKTKCILSSFFPKLGPPPGFPLTVNDTICTRQKPEHPLLTHLFTSLIISNILFPLVCHCHHSTSESPPLSPGWLLWFGHFQLTLLWPIFFV